jgi:alkane 1-monooxygenase
MTTAPQTRPILPPSLTKALPFWVSLGLIPLAWLAAVQGGWWLALLPLATWYLFAGLDLALGLNTENLDPETQTRDLKWYRAVTVLWVPLQFGTLFGVLAYVTGTDHQGAVWEWAMFAGMGILTGTVGINYAHELMHQKPKWERTLGDILLAMVLYSHFRSEHMLVHHRYVGTPRDAVTARYGESFWRYFLRVLRDCPASAWEAEAAMLERKGKPVWALGNPFWRYAALQLGFVGLAFWIGGLWGVFLFGTQAFWAVWQLELVNYVEHYGLTREHLGEGKYEHVKPHHSWNSAQKASNWLLINLQRHSDHHFKPDRRFPLLQNRDADEAPQLPYGYSVMTVAALIPRLWRRMMNPRVRAWRARYYPQISDWTDYAAGRTPMPR